MKRNIPLMYAVGLTQGMVFYGPVATLYRQAQGVTVFEITLIESISMLQCILLEIPWGMVADRIGYKKAMVLSNLIFFASKLIFWQATSFAGFLAERILLSLAVRCGHKPSLSLLPQTKPAARAGDLQQFGNGRSADCHSRLYASSSTAIQTIGITHGSKLWHSCPAFPGAL